jgi:hypothetical protein
MPVANDLARLTLGEFRERIRKDTIPVNPQFSYFSASLPFTDEDLRDYIDDPLTALPAALAGLLPKVTILLVPFLERANGKERPEQHDIVCFETPLDGKALRSVQWTQEGEAILAFAIDELEVADYHYELYHQLAWLAGQVATAEFLHDYFGIIREELINRMHGEVDEESWQQKQVVLRKQANVKRDSKAFREYARQSFVDTLTLFLHGICCDIDVETGPRQLPSRYLKRRLKLLQSMFPPPKGYAVFPEEMDQEAG